MRRSCLSISLLNALLTTKRGMGNAPGVCASVPNSASLRILLLIIRKDAATFGLTGHNYFMIGEYKLC